MRIAIGLFAVFWLLNASICAQQFQASDRIIVYSSVGSANVRQTSSGATSLGRQPNGSGGQIVTGSRVLVGSSYLYAYNVNFDSGVDGWVWESDLAKPTGAPPVIISILENRVIPVGGALQLGVTVQSASSVAYQWYRNGSALPGRTDSVISIVNCQITDSGSYSVGVANAAGAVFSGACTVSVVEAYIGQSVIGPGYIAGSAVSISWAVLFSGPMSSRVFAISLPAGWGYVADNAVGVLSRPTLGAEAVLRWTLPDDTVSPFVFSTAFYVPLSASGVKSISTMLTFSTPAGPAYVTGFSDPILLSDYTYHDADTSRDGKVSLTELTRLIELYNTRFGTARTGSYSVASVQSEDGFSPDSSRSSVASVSLSRYHSSDVNRNGRIELTELTRVIELYNCRSGTTRTGQYKPQAGTEDGFAPGP